MYYFVEYSTCTYLSQATKMQSVFFLLLIFGKLIELYRLCQKLYHVRGVS